MDFDELEVDEDGPDASITLPAIPRLCPGHRVECGQDAYQPHPSITDSINARGNRGNSPEVSAREMQPVTARSVDRVLPGPAGRLQRTGPNLQHAQGITTSSDDWNLSLATDNWDGCRADFSSGAWDAALDSLDLSSFDASHPMLQFNCASVRGNSKSRKIPQMMLMVATMKTNGLGDVFVVFKDPTGAISGTIQRAAIAAEPEITHGCVVLLKQVPLLVLSEKECYLCVTLSNIIQLDTFPAQPVDAAVATGSAGACRDSPSQSYVRQVPDLSIRLDPVVNFIQLVMANQS